MPFDPQHDKLLRIALSLPETTEDWPWGSIHCKVAGKIFVGWGRGEDGAMSIGLRTTPALQSMLVASDPRVTIAKYTGKYGGIDIRLDPKPDWAEVEHFIVESWRIVAPKKVVAAYDAARGGESPAKPVAAKKAAAKKSAAKVSVAKKPPAKPVAKKVAPKKAAAAKRSAKAR
jgi:hypothetical protein